MKRPLSIYKTIKWWASKIVLQSDTELFNSKQISSLFNVFGYFVNIRTCMGHPIPNINIAMTNFLSNKQVQTFLLNPLS